MALTSALQEERLGIAPVLSQPPSDRSRRLLPGAVRCAHEVTHHLSTVLAAESRILRRGFPRLPRCVDQGSRLASTKATGSRILWYRDRSLRLPSNCLVPGSCVCGTGATRSGRRTVGSCSSADRSFWSSRRLRCIRWSAWQPCSVDDVVAEPAQDGDWRVRGINGSVKEAYGARPQF